MVVAIFDGTTVEQELILGTILPITVLPFHLSASPCSHSLHASTTPRSTSQFVVPRNLLAVTQRTATAAEGATVVAEAELQSNSVQTTPP